MYNVMPWLNFFSYEASYVVIFDYNPSSKCEGTFYFELHIKYCVSAHLVLYFHYYIIYIRI
jgi:hypothetical protein